MDSAGRGQVAMRVTVTALPNDPADLGSAWTGLGEHLRSECSDLVVLPEMPFSRWLAAQEKVDARAWAAAVRDHERWIGRFGELGVSAVASTRPVIENGRRTNQGFVWQRDGGVRDVHRKRFLPDEPGFFEASWYEPGPDSFEVVEIGDRRAAFAICTELWFHRPFREYARRGVDLLLCPRATLAPSADKWLAGGRVAAVVSGAYCLSSNFAGPAEGDVGVWGGLAWVVEPQEGMVLATTSDDSPFRTVEIDPAVADAAKRTYPRYVRD